MTPSETAPPPRILLVMSNHWERSLLRAELIERGLDAVGAVDLASALLYPAVETGRGPVCVILVDQDALVASAAPRIEILTARHGRPPIILLASTQLEQPRGSWHLVLDRPVMIGEIATAIEQLAHSTGSSTAPHAK